MKKLIFGLICAIGLSTTAIAAQAPDEMIRSSVDQMRTLIKQNRASYKADKGAYYKVVDEVLVPHFDSHYIALAVLGRAARTATDDQKSQFETTFKNMLIHSYADALLDSDDVDTAKIDVKPPRIEGSDGSVDTVLTRAGKPPATVSFGVHNANDEWKIRDITIESISLVVNFRSQISEQIKQSSIDDVIKKMQAGQVLQKPTIDKPEGAKASG